MVVVRDECMDEAAPCGVRPTGECVFRRAIKPRALRKFEREYLEQVRCVLCARYDPLGFFPVVMVPALAGLHILASLLWL